MGRSYWFECSRCGYRAKVSGRPDRGLDFFVETIACADCKRLYDAVTRFRVPQQTLLGAGLRRLKPTVNSTSPKFPPSFDAVLNKLPYKGVRQFRWIRFSLQCPVSATHRVRTWNDPDKCPLCGVFLEKSALPFRVWD